MSFNFGSPAAGGFSFGTATTTSAPSTVTFGAPAATTAPFSLGGSGFAGFNFGGAGATAAAPSATTASGLTTLPAPTPSFGFGTMAPAAAPAAAPASTGFSFGTSLAAATTTAGMGIAAPSSQPAAFSFSSGLSAPATTSTVATTPMALPSFSLSTATPPVAAAATPIPFGLNIPKSTTTATPVLAAALSAAPAITAAATPASTATNGLSGFLTAKTDSSTAIAKTTTATTSVGFGAFGAPAPTTSSSTAAPVVGLTTATTTTPAAAAGSVMTYHQLEEAINKWSLELEEQEKVFLNQATQVNAWDRLLVANGDKIVSLNESVEQVKLDQQRLEHELDFIKGQQSELEDVLIPLEASLAHAPPPDAERERTYQLAETLDAQLQRMSDDLREIIEHLNADNKNADNLDNPVTQIGRVLNAHMDSLQWIDQTTADVQKKLDEVTRMHEIRKKESERTGFL